MLGGGLKCFLHFPPPKILEDDPEVKGMLGSVENSNRYIAQFPFKMYVRP